jgi:hypothetical protein
MPIVLKYASPAVTGLAAYAGGLARGQEREKERRMRLLEEQGRMKYGAWQAGIERQFRVGLQGEVFKQQKELALADDIAREAAAMQKQTWEVQGIKEKRTYEEGQTEKEHTWKEGEADIEFGRKKELGEIEFGQKKKLGDITYGRQRELEWRRQAVDEIEKGLASGDFKFEGWQDTVMKQYKAEMAKVRVDRSIDDAQKQQWLDQLQEGYDAIYFHPQNVRADEREKTPEERTHVLPGGATIYDVPGGRPLLIPPRESPEAKRDLSDPAKYGSAFNSVYRQIWAERKAEAINTNPAPPTRDEVHQRMRAMGYDVSSYPNTWEEQPRQQPAPQLPQGASPKQLPAPAQGAAPGQSAPTAPPQGEPGSGQLPPGAVSNPDGTVTYQGQIYRRR